MFTTNFAREFAHGKILLMDFSLNLFQGSKTGDKLLLRFYTVIFFLFHKLNRTMNVMLQN